MQFSLSQLWYNALNGSTYVNIVNGPFSNKITYKRCTVHSHVGGKYQIFNTYIFIFSQQNSDGVWLHPGVFVYASKQAGPGIAVTVVLCYAVVCMIIDQRVMQDKAQCASVDCFAVSTAGSRIVVSLQTAKAV